MNYYEEVKEDIKFELTKIRSIFEEIEELLQLTGDQRKEKQFLELDENSWWELLKLYTRLKLLIDTMERVDI